MGIKYFTSFLDAHPFLKEKLRFQVHKNHNYNQNNSNNNNRSEFDENGYEYETVAPPPPMRKTVVWDFLSFRQKICSFGRQNHRSAFLSDFRPTVQKLQAIVQLFHDLNMELVVFIDGYHCHSKRTEKRHREEQRKVRIMKNIAILKRIENTRSSSKQRRQLSAELKNFIFVKKEAIVQMLLDLGVTVYRGSGNRNLKTHTVSDIDQDMVKFCIDHTRHGTKHILAILTMDTDFYGFPFLPKHIFIGHNFFYGGGGGGRNKHNTRYKKNRGNGYLEFIGYYPCRIRQYLKMDRSIEQLMRLIHVMGNDFVGNGNTNSVTATYKRCGYRIQNADPKRIYNHAIGANVNNGNILKIAAHAITSGFLSPRARLRPRPTDINPNADLEMVQNFYLLQHLDLANYSLQANASPRFFDLELNGIFSSGICMHDINGYGYTILERIAKVRRCVYYKLAVKYGWLKKTVQQQQRDYAHNNNNNNNYDTDTGADAVFLNEYLPKNDLLNPKKLVIADEEVVVQDLSGISQSLFDMVVVFDMDTSRRQDANVANLHCVARTAIEIMHYSYLFDGDFIGDVQIKALELQFEFANTLRDSDFDEYEYHARGIHGNGNGNGVAPAKEESDTDKYKWHLLDGFHSFRGVHGHPRTKDLTAQWMYLKISDVICFHPSEIRPSVPCLFNGPLYHYFCQELAVRASGKIRTEYYMHFLGRLPYYYNSNTESKSNHNRTDE